VGTAGENTAWESVSLLLQDGNSRKRRTLRQHEGQQSGRGESSDDPPVMFSRRPTGRGVSTAFPNSGNPDAGWEGTPREACGGALRIPKVALLFLTRGDMPHERVWRTWLESAAGKQLPSSWQTLNVRSAIVASVGLQSAGVTKEVVAVQGWTENGWDEEWEGWHMCPQQCSARPGRKTRLTTMTLVPGFEPWQVWVEYPLSFHIRNGGRSIFNGTWTSDSTVKCACNCYNGGRMVQFGGAGGKLLSGAPRGLCSLAHVSGALIMKHLVAQFGLTLTSTCLGLGLIYLVIISWSRCTPSLRTGNV
jgi:hypothetical protein